MKLYGLYSEKRECLMEVSVSSNNGADFCNDCEVSLSKYFGEQILCSTDKEKMERIAECGPTEWYNAGFGSPNWDEHYFGKLKVVCLNDFVV